MSNARDEQSHDQRDEQEEHTADQRDENSAVEQQGGEHRGTAPLEDLDAEEIVEGAREFLGAEHRGAPASDTDAPPPG